MVCRKVVPMSVILIVANSKAKKDTKVKPIVNNSKTKSHDKVKPLVTNSKNNKIEMEANPLKSAALAT